MILAADPVVGIWIGGACTLVATITGALTLFFTNRQKRREQDLGEDALTWRQMRELLEDTRRDRDDKATQLERQTAAHRSEIDWLVADYTRQLGAMRIQIRELQAELDRRPNR